MFTNLHTHTEYSLLDGLARIPALLDRAKALGQEALAITDHGAMHGVIEFYREARARDIKPIIGVEAYVAPGSRFNRESRDKSGYHHLTLLARDAQGYKNLMALTTLANLEGFYYKPRMDRELLAKYGKGIIALTGCPSAELFKALQDGRDEDARAATGFYKDVFDAVFVEIQDHPDAAGELRGMLDRVNPRLLAFADATGMPLAGTNDSHYTAPEDARSHELLLCIGSNSTVDDPKRFRLEGDSYYLIGEEEIRRIPLFRERPDAIDNTQRVAEMCDLTLEFGRVMLPDPELPAGMTPQQYLTQVCHEGLKRRYGDAAAGPWPLHPNPEPPVPGAADEVRRRLEYELHVVEVTGFAAYMLIVAEIARAAAQRGIAMGVRGSAAASIILYTLDVTDICPIRTRLVFERFLNVERREMPDVDMDFADDRREEMIRWAAERYGHDRVAQICSFGTLKPKAAIKDVGRALGYTVAETDRVARMVPDAPNMTMERAFAENAELRQVYEADPQVKRLVDAARPLEGVARHVSTHAAGVLISRDPLIDVVPLQRPVRGGEQALPLTQWEMNTVAEAGLLKMDFLGLGNLTILARAVELIKQQRGIDLDLRTLADGDAKTYEMLGRGETFGVFQLESAGMRRYIQELKPSSIADLSAMVALYRPGPMQHIPRFCAAKHGKAPIEYPHPALANILDETYGVIVYQDQVLFILRQFAGYTMGEADKVRKAMGKKIASMMAEQREKFVKGAKGQGYTAEDASAVFDLIEPFAGYAFNKAHSVCYATLSYQTAYLVANYPAEYLTAVMMLANTHPAGFGGRVGAAVAECIKLGIPVLPPHVNASAVNFTIERQTGASTATAAVVPEGATTETPAAIPLSSDAPSESIRFGLSCIKNVGEGAIAGIVAEREEKGPFASLEDFCRRIQVKGFNKRALESLIKAGALDGFGPNRTTLATNVDRIASLIAREQKLRDSGQTTMFDLFGDQVQTPLPALELDPVQEHPGEVLAWEKDLLGVYVSDHPFKRAHTSLAAKITAVAAEINEEMAGRDLMIAGMVAGTRTLLTKAGKSFVIAQIEDLSGKVEVVVWPDTYEKSRDLWQEGKILLLSAKVRMRNDRLDVTVDDAGEWDEATGSVRGSTLLAAVAPLVRSGDRGAPPGDDGYLTDEDSGWEPDEAQRGGRSAPGVNEQGAGTTAPVTAPERRHSGDVHVAVPAPRAPISNGKRHPHARPEPKPITTEDRERRRLRITLRETDDEPADRRRLNELVQVLRSLPGPDEVRLVVQTPYNVHHVSMGTTLATDGIDQRLGPILEGWGELVIEPVRAG